MKKVLALVAAITLSASLGVVAQAAETQSTIKTESKIVLRYVIVDPGRGGGGH